MRSKENLVAPVLGNLKHEVKNICLRGGVEGEFRLFDEEDSVPKAVCFEEYRGEADSAEAPVYEGCFVARARVGEESRDVPPTESSLLAVRSTAEPDPSKPLIDPIDLVLLPGELLFTDLLMQEPMDERMDPTGVLPEVRIDWLVYGPHTVPEGALNGKVPHSARVELLLAVRGSSAKTPGNLSLPARIEVARDSELIPFGAAFPENVRDLA